MHTCWSKAFTLDVHWVEKFLCGGGLSPPIFWTRGASAPLVLTPLYTNVQTVGKVAWAHWQPALLQNACSHEFSWSQRKTVTTRLCTVWDCTMHVPHFQASLSNMLYYYFDWWLGKKLSSLEPKTVYVSCSKLASFPGSPSPFLTFFMRKYYTQKIKGEGKPGTEPRPPACGHLGQPWPWSYM